jgi:hypothetical protein
MMKQRRDIDLGVVYAPYDTTIMFIRMMRKGQEDEGPDILSGMALGDSTPRERCREPRIPTTIGDKG